MSPYKPRHRLTHSKAPEPSARVGRIRWSCGQVSTHNLSILREVDL